MLKPNVAAVAAGAVLAFAGGAGAAVAATHHGTPVKGSKHHTAHSAAQTTTDPCNHGPSTTTTSG